MIIIAAIAGLLLLAMAVISTSVVIAMLYGAVTGQPDFPPWALLASLVLWVVLIVGILLQDSRPRQ